MRTRVLVGCLFFAVAGSGWSEETPTLQFEELRIAVDTLRTENRKLKEDAQQREATIRLLNENLAIARTESELFQKRWAEAQARMQTLGVNVGDAGTAQLQRQLVEGMRALYLAEAERQRLVEQLQKLLTAVEQGGDVAGEADRAKQLLASAEQPAATGQPAARRATLEDARVLDVNAPLRVVVLNVGLLQDARVGMPFVVVRGDRVIAEVRVVEVRRSICGAVIENVAKGVTLAAGDTARVTKS